MKRLLLGLVILGCAGEAQQEVRGPRVALIFCDVTSSLNENQLTAVADLTAQVVRNLEPPVRYQVIPIMMQTEEASPVMDENVPDLTTPSDRQKYKQALQALPAFLRERLSQLYGKVNEPSADPDRSCIVGALSRASGLLEQFDNASSADVILISDMIEECKQTPFGFPLRLNKVEIGSEIEKVKSAGALPSLKQARIAFILPASSEEAIQARPSLRDLRIFWGSVGLKAELSQGDLKDPRRFYLGPGLPERLRAVW